MDEWSEMAHILGGKGMWWKNVIVVATVALMGAGECEAKKLGVINGCDIKNKTSCEGIDLSGQNLEQASLQQAKLAGANLSAANLKYANLSGANLRDANLSGADLTQANIAMTDFSGADLTGARLQGSYQGTTVFKDADLSGATWQDGKVCGAESIGSCK